MDPDLIRLGACASYPEVDTEGYVRVRRIAGVRVESVRAAARAAWDADEAAAAERRRSVSSARHLALVEPSASPCNAAFAGADLAVRELLDLAHSPREDVAAEAQVRLQYLLGRLLVDMPPRGSALADGRPTSTFTRLEQLLRSVRAGCVVIAPHRSGRIGPAWAAMGLALTMLAAWELVVGNVRVAALIVASRMMISLMLPPPYSIGPEHQNRTRISFKACVAGHVSDAIMLTGVSLALMASERTMYGAFVACTTTLMLGATLLRVGALQSADYVRRLSLERLFRNGSALVGLMAASWFQPHIPSGRFPLVVICAIGPAVYAGMEIVRVHRRDVLNRSRRSRQQPAERRVDEITEVGTALGPGEHADPSGRGGAAIA